MRGALEGVLLAALSGLGARSERPAEACHSLLQYHFNYLGGSSNFVGYSPSEKNLIS